jgi:hypothetical protein
VLTEQLQEPITELEQSNKYEVEDNILGGKIHNIQVIPELSRYIVLK